MTKNPFSLFLVVIFALSCSSCSKEFRPHDKATLETQKSNVIRPEKAIENLETLISELYGNKTKSNSFNVDDLTVFGNIPTKSGISLPDTTLYILNFADSSGFAVMAAQTFINAPVLCVTESGSLSNEDLAFALQNIGNQSHDIELTDKSGLISDIILSSIIGMYYSELDGSDPEGPDPNEPDPDDDDTSNMPDIEEGMNPPRYEYETLTKIGPLLSTKWHQHSPFNDFNANLYPAGCAAIATAQILTYNEYGSYNGQTFDWDLLKTVCNYAYPHYAGSSTARNEASRLSQIVGLSENCNIDYGTNGSSGSVSGAARTFENFGYNNVTVHKYLDESDINRIIDMLTKRLPVYVRGQKDVWSGNTGHAWVVDGLFIRNATNQATGEMRTEKMFHVNWGWNGECDGYYALGIFDTRQRTTYEWNYDSHNYIDFYVWFTWGFRSITYSLN